MQVTLVYFVIVTELLLVVLNLEKQEELQLEELQLLHLVMI